MEQKIIKGLPSSFVAANMKIANDRGSGEAKLWVGQMSNSNELDAFFSFDEGYSYLFSQNNMLEYMNQVKLEYVFHKFNDYKNISLATWNEYYDLIQSCSEEDFVVHLTKFTDDTRYYVRAEENIFKKIFRNIAVPKITNLVFSKDLERKVITLTLALNLDYGVATNENNSALEDGTSSHALYGMHMDRNIDVLSVDNPHMCIGWSDLGDLSNISTKEELERKYDEKYPEETKGKKAQDIGVIWKFVREFKKGDYIIFSKSPVCHIGYFTSCYRYEENSESEFKHIRNVQWVRQNIQFSELSENLRSSLRTRNTLWSLNKYKKELEDLIENRHNEGNELQLRYCTGLDLRFPLNRIVFGAPGTGKSYKINEDRKALLGEDGESNYERVTFHPDYSYAHFVGTYKPVMERNSDGTPSNNIAYKFVPGPFLRVYVKALQSGRTEKPEPFLLIIEEINRANVAAVFGDVFQLLDRDDDGVSEYPIQASEDVKAYLADELGGRPEDYSQIKLPDNMFIWATMNSADQGVFPMDTAFKRRWDFTYLGIDDNDGDLRGKTVVLGKKPGKRVEWNKLRKAINGQLASLGINEDKQLGPYFIGRKIVVPEGEEIDPGKFAEVFKNKVLMYLFEDAARQRRSALFAGVGTDRLRYSELCRAFDEEGIGIFSNEIVNKVKAEDVTASNETGAATGDGQS